MHVLHNSEELATWRGGAGEVGFVPTMGYLHAGHMALVARARTENDAAIASIFVNPTQFGPRDDLASYPRDLDRDLALLRAEGTAAVFIPSESTMYPPGFQTWVTPGALAERLEGAARPGHFRGVATVVLKLFQLVRPDRAYFGRKDAQQLAVIRRMVIDLAVPVTIVGCPTVREPDGLALSSRNSYLSSEERAAAPVLYRALSAAEDAWRRGEVSAERLRALMRDTLATEPRAAVDYVSIADGESLAELDEAVRGALVSLAVRIGSTRLIDNVTLN